MGNTYFSFKQFTVNQDKCAMKVCTDACLFGAWTASMIEKYLPDVSNILDIGAGTGLLSLMLAQKYEAVIDAVEIDAGAARQAKENMASSPWKKINVHNVPIENFETEHRYELIVTNPPFYERSLLSPAADRNAAMHDRYLTLDQLVLQIHKLLSRSGYASVLLPFARGTNFKELLSAGNFSIAEILHVRPSSNHEFFRSMYLITSKKMEPVIDEMSIYDANRQYTPRFRELLVDYYLQV